jgi:ribosomal protein S18 acetylase RimI-like enzyme
MGAALSTSWRVARPLVNCTVGDLEWWQVSALPFDAWGERIRVWEASGEIVAFAWLSGTGALDWHQRADLEARVRTAIVDESVAWAVESTRAAAVAGGVVGDGLTTWAMDADEPLGRLLGEHGFAPAPEPTYTHWYQRLDGPAAPPAPVVPGGYRIHGTVLPDDLERRVEVHRSAFAPSRMTVDKYAAMPSMAHYDGSRDLVVEAPDGSFAAFTMVWWDPDAGIGEFEPVGTHADHRRIGLGKAVNLAGLALLRELGAVDALVFSACANAASEALYASAGFEAVTRHRAWVRALD